MVLTPYSVTEEWSVAPDDQPLTARRCACPEPLLDHDADGWRLCLLCGREPAIRLPHIGGELRGWDR